MFLDSCSICGVVSRGGSVRLIIGAGGGRICMSCAGHVLRPVLTERFVRTPDDLLLAKREMTVSERCDMCGFTVQYVGELTGAEVFKICRRDAARVAEIFLGPIQETDATIPAPIPQRLGDDRIRCGACGRILHLHGQEISIDAEPLKILNPHGPELRMYPIFTTPDGMLHKCHRWHTPNQDQREAWLRLRADLRHRLPPMNTRGVVVS